MSDGEGQAWSGAAAAVAVPPPQSSTDAVAALGSTPAPGTVVAVAAPWELLYQSGAPAQQADLLALASRQGLLHGYQLPPPSPSSRCLPPADEPHTWNLLGKLLAGQVSQLEPVRPTPLEAVDQALDETQRHAVAAALATPDVCLIQGLPGTGKSRVMAEIVTQAAKRGDRVLMLATHPAALDRVLERVAHQGSLCPIRCVGPEEHLAQLPPSIRALTLPERAAAIRQETLRTAHQTRQAAELQCARRRHEASLWSQLKELAQALAAARDRLAPVEAKMAAVESQVLHDAGAGAGRLAADVRALQRASEQQLAQLVTEAAAVERGRDQERGQLAELDQQIAVIEPLAAAKHQGRWWSPRWWKATCQGDVVGQLGQLQARQRQLQAAIEDRGKRLQDLAEAHRLAKEKNAAEIQACLKIEIASRQRKLLSILNQHRDEIQQHEVLWGDLCRQIQEDALHPTAQTPEAVGAAQERWQQHRRDDEARCAFAREWAEFLESSSSALAAKLPGFANLVAATPAALAADPHFGDAAAVGGQFDLLVFEEAHHLAESEFLKAARRARQWVLVGEPPLTSTPLPAAERGAGRGSGTRGERGQCFQRLWEHLDGDPSLSSYAWFREGQRFGCRLRSLTAEQRQWLESEPLADAPDVELRILALPQVRPVLAEVLFPGAMTVLAAKDFLFHELGLRDLGRTVLMDRQYRMTAALGDVVFDLLGAGGLSSRAAAGPAEPVEPAVEFIPVLGSGTRKGAGRNDGSGLRNAGPAVGGRLPATGAGLEIDLAKTRLGDRVPNELHGSVPGKGFVNVAEARAVVHKLEELVGQGMHGRRYTGTQAASLAVIALYPAQAELIRHLIQGSPQLAPYAASIAIGPPGAFRQREADVVVISLTRSHSHRAVAYGEGPAAWELAWTRARRRLVLVGDPGNLFRRGQWRGVLDHLDETAGNREAWLVGQLVRYLQGRGRYQRSFRWGEGGTA